MNTKKAKNKQKQHKPPTPQPALEVSNVAAEKMEQATAEEKSELIKSEERVPEIVSEVVQPILPNKVSESDVPKKPKRNRGKKKKSDKDDEADEMPEGPLSEDSKIYDKVEEITDMESKSLETPEVTPAARKKKNKNKKQSELQSEQDIKIAPIKKDEDLTDLKIVTVVPVVTDTSEEIKSKKKNKKKKRNDSERSEKAEEIVSCTAAFQKLLEPREDKKDTKKEIKAEDVKAIEKNPAKDASQPLKTVEIGTDKQSLKPEATIRDKSTENKNQSKDEGGKGKKKNKKQITKEESEDEALRPLQTKTEIDSEGQTVTVPADVRVEEYITKEEIKFSKVDADLVVKQLPLVEKEKSPKPKAKIAKPVEKKRKDKQEVSSTENLSEKETKKIGTDNPAESIKIEGKQITEQPVKTDASVENVMKAKFSSECGTKLGEISQESETPKAIETKEEFISQTTEAASEPAKIQLPESGMGKKRKKSPKPKPSKIIGTLDQPIAVLEQTPSEPEKQDILSSPQVVATQKEIVQHKEVKSESKTEVTSPNKETAKESQPIPLGFGVMPLQESTYIKISQIPEITSEQLVAQPIIITPVESAEVPVETQTEKEIKQVLEASPGKKRKKSPKPQKKPEKSLESTESSTVSSEAQKITHRGESKTTEQSSTFTDTVKEIKKESNTDSLSDMPILEDIEIHSIKADESEGSVCDITPDIHYPRASSQLQDNNNNNNTVIQDITGSDIKLNIPNILPDTPIVQGSGETPLPQSTQSSVNITEIITSDVKQKDNATATKVVELKSEEKTDLKSKVLDVNQGMEELRRSIERSLAELSSMEKSEKEAADQFSKAQAKLELITEMASKKSEGKKHELSTKAMKQTQEKITDTHEIKDKRATPDKNKATDELTFSPITEIKSDPISLPSPNISAGARTEQPTETTILSEQQTQSQTPPVPARKDNKGKGKKKGKGKQDFETTAVPSTTAASGTSASATITETKDSTQESKKDEKSQTTDNTTQNKGKQQSASNDDEFTSKDSKESSLTDFERIETFEDALFTSTEENEQDINKTFEMIASEANKCDESQNPAINITAPTEDEENPNNKKENENIHPVSQPKNLLGHPDIPARLNRTDYKKEKNKHQTPNTKQATVKIKDAVPIEVTKESKESQTENKRRFLKDKTVTESITSMISENEDYIYKYSFRKVFLPSACHVCKKDLKIVRVPCNFCNLIFYCSIKHKDEDYQQHQSLCFAVSTIVHLRDQKHIYSDAKNITGHEYRLLRMQMIVSCEKVLKRRLVPWEQEALLYPRICADVGCREWRQNKLVDCEGCGQISYCSGEPNHLPKSHQRWCKSYILYNKLVVYQQTKGRLEPRLPTRVMAEVYQVPEKLNEVLASMYEEKIDMTDIQYAALTQIATAPLTAAYCHQLYNNKMNAIYANGAVKKSSFTIHVVGAELQFEADALNKWEVFFLHLRPDVKDLRVVLVGPDLNPSKLPLDLLSKIKLCENCRQNKRRVLFEFQDKKTYYEYWSTEFITPDLVCAFNPSIQRCSVFNGKDTWPSTIKCILKLKVPFIVTSYTMSELQKDLERIKECSDVEVNTISEAEFNAFASVRPDRNFISDDEMPLLFKNFCFSTVCGAF
ncbi:hypothetical protein O0L34_g1794 [Tuta absoluta]|nr:hypothetical protein O0L34_g1794 [Tuta absoluta]